MVVVSRLVKSGEASKSDVPTRAAGTILPGLRPAKSRVVGLCIALSTVVVLLFLYTIVNVFAAWRGVTIFDPEQLFVIGERSMDSRVPYVPWTVRIYMGHFLVYLLPVAIYRKTDFGGLELLKLYRGLITITLAACVIFVVCPAEISRQAAKDHNSPTEDHATILSLHDMSPPFNTWPSLHVAQSGLIFLMVARWLTRWHWNIVICLAWVALSISTLTIKEHFIWDVITGSLLALAYWYWRLKPDIDTAECGRQPPDDITKQLTETG